MEPGVCEGHVPPFGSNFFSFSCSFWQQIMPNNRFLPQPQGLATSSGSGSSSPVGFEDQFSLNLQLSYLVIRCTTNTSADGVGCICCAADNQVAQRAKWQRESGARERKRIHFWWFVDMSWAIRAASPSLLLNCLVICCTTRAWTATATTGRDPSTQPQSIWMVENRVLMHQ